MSAGPVRIQPPSPEEIRGAGVIKLAELLQEDQPAEPALRPLAAGEVREIGGRRDGPDPTRYGDWEKNGRCIDF